MGHLALQVAALAVMLTGAVGYVAEYDGRGHWIVTRTINAADKDTDLGEGQAAIFLPAGPTVVTSGPVPLYHIQAFGLQPLPGGDANPEALRRLRKEYQRETDAAKRAALRDRIFEAVDRISP